MFYSFFNLAVTAYEISKVLILGTLVNKKDEDIIQKLQKFKSEVNELKLFLDEAEVYKVKANGSNCLKDTSVYIFKASVDEQGEIVYESVADGLKVKSLSNFENVEAKLRTEIDSSLDAINEVISEYQDFVEAECITFIGHKIDFDLISSLLVLFGTLFIALIESLSEEEE